LREDELAKQEREIIESLEREEKEKTGSGNRFFGAKIAIFPYGSRAFWPIYDSPVSFPSLRRGKLWFFGIEVFYTMVHVLETSHEPLPWSTC
jgi:hypothetical protein